MAIVRFDTTTILNYYASQLIQNGLRQSAQTAASVTASAAAKSAEAAGTPPWAETGVAKSDSKKLNEVLAASSFVKFDATELRQLTSKGGTAADAKRLFALYQAVDMLATLAKHAATDKTVAGQLNALDTRFQTGLGEIRSFLDGQSFDNLTVLAGVKTSYTTTTTAIPLTKTSYTGGTVVKGDVAQAVSGLAGDETFTITVKRGGDTITVPIDLANVAGTLSLDNIASYINGQLQAYDVNSRFHRTAIGQEDSAGNKSFGLMIAYASGETIAFAADAAKPAVYVAGNTGADGNASGRLVKLADGPTSAEPVFSAALAPNSQTVEIETPGAATNEEPKTITKEVPGGTLTVRASAMDADGNIYVAGDTTGDMQGAVNQGARDAVLAKYDSAGNLLWTRVLGSSETAKGYAVAVDASGAVYVAGSVTDKLTATAIGGGTDGFVAKYSSDGKALFTTQIAPVANDEIRAITVAADGAVYVAGQVGGIIGAGETNQGGTDVFLRKLDSTGKIVFSRQFGSPGTDAPSRIVVADDGNLIVSSIEDGQAMVRKLDASGAGSVPIWEVALGALEGGTLGGLAVKNGKVYVSGATGNADLTAGGTAAIVNPFGGESDAFVFAISDGGASATADFVSYIGTADAERAGGIAVTDGALYVTGGTYGTFPEQSQSTSGAVNGFVAKLDTAGVLAWTYQYGGLRGQSAGVAITVDAQGSSVLDALGLPKGTISTYQPNDLLSQSSVREGDYFTLKLTTARGTKEKRITVEAGETMRSLANKIRAVLGLNGEVKVSFSTNGQTLKVTAGKDTQIEFVPGKDSFDALAGLGIATRVLINRSADKQPAETSSAKLRDNKYVKAEEAAAVSAAASDGKTKTFLEKKVISLGLVGRLDLSTKANAADVASQLESMLASIRTAFRKLTDDPTLAMLTSGSGPKFSSTGDGTVPAHIMSQLSGYRAALSRLGAGSFSAQALSLISKI